MRDLLITLVFLAYLSVGALVQLVAALGYVWVDTFSPQQVSYGLLTHVPVSLMVAVVAVGAYMLLDRRAAPRPAPPRRRPAARPPARVRGGGAHRGPGPRAIRRPADAS